MKHNIIHLNGFIYAVDSKGYSKNGEMIYYIYSDKICLGIIPDGQEEAMIVASNDPALKDLPLLPAVEEDITKIASRHWMEIPQDVKTFAEPIDYVTGFVEGYKAAKAKQYSEEDLLKYIEVSSKFYKKFISEDIKSGVYKTVEKPFKKLEERAHKAAIDFLKPKPIAVELEMEHGDYGDKTGLRSWLKVDSTNHVIVKQWYYE